MAGDIYHRRESTTQTPEVAQKQEKSGEIWGRAPVWSDRPKVQAYRGQLPEDVRGIEFTTEIEPDPGQPPHRAAWSRPEAGVRIEGEFAKITATVVKNT